MDAITVRSDVAPDGTYVVAIEVGPDESWIVDRDAAQAHAAAVIDAVARADFDAAVLAQLSSLKIPADAVGQMITDLRKDRPDTTATEPLSFVPGVSHRDGRGFITLHLHGQPSGQLELDDARTHAMAVLEVVAAVDLDAQYRAALVGIIGLDDRTARAVVGDLMNHRRESC